jgi:hypothetical protein
MASATTGITVSSSTTGVSISSTGLGYGHYNIQPSTVAWWIIKF